MALSALDAHARIDAGVRAPGASALRLRGRRWGRDVLSWLAYPRSPDDYLQALNANWTLDRVVARIEAIQHETRDTTSLYLAPSGNWRPHRAGQHVLLTATLSGVDHTRCFSLSVAPRLGAPMRLTIKAHEAGRLSCWVRDTARVGDQVQLSQALGAFVLPDPVPERLLFVSGGSGMTPLLAMAQALVDAGYEGSLRWIHSERTEVALLDEMRSACVALGVTLDLHRTGAEYSSVITSRDRGHLTGADIAALVPDYRERHLLTCGPRGLMDAARALYAEAGLAHRVGQEDFQPLLSRARPPARDGLDDEAPQLLLARSRRAIRAEPGVSLLQLAEQAGLHPPHGCRRGICNTCKCTKRSGTVLNHLTGAESDASNEEIRLCIHSPITDVTLDL